MYNIQFEAVKQNMLNMIKASKQEFDRYKSTKDIVLLQQAGEKLFNALENYIQFVNKNMAGSFYEIKGLIKEKSLRKLLYDAKDLHIFFYRGELEMNKEDVIDLYLNVRNRIEERIKRLWG